MPAHIRQIASDIITNSRQNNHGTVTTLVRALGDEINRLDVKDFVPEAQSRFISVRDRVRRWATETTWTPEKYTALPVMAQDVCSILELYAGEGSRGVTRSFVFVSDPHLRTIVERDYGELSLILFPSGAHKSTVVMAGSILEAILQDQLTKDTTAKSKALAAKSAPKNKDLSKGEWRLRDLIEVSAELGLLPADRANSIDQILRDYRNFVHPMKEIRGAHPCTEAEAQMAKGALDSVCNYFK